MASEIIRSNVPYSRQLESRNKRMALVVIPKNRDISSMTIDVIVPFHHFNSFLLEAITSVKATQGVNVRIIAVNDSGVFLQRDKIGLRSQDVLLKSLGKGYIDALATGVKASTSEYIAFQDSDDFSDSFRLKYQLEDLLSNSYDLVAGRLVRTNMSGQISPVASPFGTLSGLLTPSERLVFGPNGADSSILARAEILKSTWSVHAQFSPSFADYGWLLSVSGRLKLGYSPNAIYYYRAHNAQMSQKAKDMTAWTNVAALWTENVARFDLKLSLNEKELLNQIKSIPNVGLAIAFPASLVKLSKNEKQILRKTITLIQKITKKDSKLDNFLIKDALYRRGFVATRGLQFGYWGAGIRMIVSVIARICYGILPRIGK